VRWRCELISKRKSRQICPSRGDGNYTISLTLTMLATSSRDVCTTKSFCLHRTFGSEIVTLQICEELSVALRSKLRVSIPSQTRQARRDRRDGISETTDVRLDTRDDMPRFNFLQLVTFTKFTSRVDCYQWLNYRVCVYLSW
jgi:hypothetical protein